MSNSKRLHLFGAGEHFHQQKKIEREQALRMPGSADASTQPEASSGAIKLPRIHAFRGTFKLFGQSINTGFVGLFVLDYLTIAYVFSTLVAPSTFAPLFAAVISFSMVCMGLYDARQRETVFGVLFHLLAALSISMCISFAAVSLIDIGPVSGYELLHATLWSSLFLMALRYLFHSFVDGRILKRRLLVVGTGKRARHIEKLRRKADQRGFDLVGFITSNTCQHCYVSAEKLIKLEGSICDYALANEIDEIVIALDDRRSGLPTDDLLDCRMSGIKISKDLDFFEREASMIQLDVIQPGWLIHAKGFNSNALRYWDKRLFDVVGAALILVFASPLLLLTFLAIKFECGLRSPIFYSQERVGRGGRPFTIFKLRSMCVDAESDGKAQWASKSDSRITRVGAIIRKYRIDEIPQLWNVIRGDMSLVGPRPERPQFVDSLCEKNGFYPERHRVAPGLTGWAQLCFPYGASEEDSIEKLKFDLYYIKNHSFIFDLYILAQTAEVVLFQRGSR